jgi:hypothetical protein
MEIGRKSDVLTLFLQVKKLAFFPSPVGMSLSKLSLAVKKYTYSRPGGVWFVRSWLGPGKSLTFFYNVHSVILFEGHWNLDPLTHV